MRRRGLEPGRGRAACRWAAAALICLLTAGTRAQVPPGAATIREAELWARIAALSATPPATQPQQDWFDAVYQSRQALAREARVYQQLYPGGGHFDEAVRLELAALFELGTLREGGLDALCARAAEILAAPSTTAAAAEAAYWDLLCRRRNRAPSSQPTSAPATAAPDADLLAEYAAYVRAYPRSRYVPRLVTHLFDAAERAGDSAKMAALAGQLAADFPQHATSAELTGRARLRQAVGTPFWPELTDVEGRVLAAEAFRGQRVAVLVWSHAEPGGRAAAEAVRRAQASRPALRVIAVNLDARLDDARAALAGLGADWTLVHDGLSGGGAFVRTWGLRATPALLVIDEAGRLQCVSGPVAFDDCLAMLAP